MIRPSFLRSSLRSKEAGCFDRLGFFHVALAGRMKSKPLSALFWLFQVVSGCVSPFVLKSWTDQPYSSLSLKVFLHLRDG